MSDDATGEGDLSGEDLAMRLHVLEMTVAAIAARLPKPDLDEVASLLVFVARGAEAASDVEGLPPDLPVLGAAGRSATRMLERIAHSRASHRSTPLDAGPPDLGKADGG
ncbi:hypothetical protein [Muricoccus radiodurans]|uniref:hypothetical protein n=1 Tax=Muricoccus radiodurans TaxID=2231721 RepID=UPI003CF51602